MCITRGALAVTAGDRVNLDQGGVRGLLRVIGAEHPPLRPTQIDVDAHTARTASLTNCSADPPRMRPPGGRIVVYRTAAAEPAAAG